LNGRTPLEVIYDAIADVNRLDPSTPTEVPQSAEDVRKVFQQLDSFLMDPDHGLERVYETMRNRKVN
jgi:hypothetical protein